ncbi:MAG: hypothetical protein E6I45_07405, partial [Chloroflexi bacterium]
MGRGLDGRQRLGDRRSGDEPGRGRPGLGRRDGPVPAARERDRAALLRAQREGLSARLGRDDAAGDGTCRPRAWRCRPRSGSQLGPRVGRPRTARRARWSTEARTAWPIRARLALRWPGEAGSVRRSAALPRLRWRSSPPSTAPRTASSRPRRRARSRRSRWSAGRAERRSPALPRRISLALALHNHQPVGNFGFVFAEVYDQAYLPMLSALERHPSVRLSLHYTGALLDWLRSERPEFLDRLAALVHRGQVELMGGGYYEPVLASLPERDRVGQLVRMADEVEALSGQRPRGAWLAERVWEPDLPTSLAAAGYRWTILDDAHFRAAAVPEENLWGAYTTEDQGRLLTVFGSEQYLRYAIPWEDVSDVIRYLQDHATDQGERVGVMGDDGEKFGGWPTTYAHAWGEGRWVDRFFHALETSSDWLTTVTPSAWLEREPPIGRVYIPTSSYAEMGEWALPAEESREFAEVLHADVAAHRPEARWLRGGFWRNFQVKYQEVN